MYVRIKGNGPKTRVYIMESVREGSKVTGVVREKLGHLEDLIRDDPDALEKLRAKLSAPKEEEARLRAERAQEILSGRVDPKAAKTERRMAARLPRDPAHPEGGNGKSCPEAPEVFYGHYALRRLWLEDLRMPQVLAKLVGRFETERMSDALGFLVACTKTVGPDDVLRSLEAAGDLLGDPARNLTPQDLFDALHLLDTQSEALFAGLREKLKWEIDGRPGVIVLCGVTAADRKTFKAAHMSEQTRIAAEAARAQGRLGDECFDAEGGLLAEMLPDWFGEDLAHGATEHLLRPASMSIALALDREGVPIDAEVFSLAHDEELPTMESAADLLRARHGIHRAFVLGHGLESARRSLADLGFDVDDLSEETPSEILNDEEMLESEGRLLPALPQINDTLHVLKAFSWPRTLCMPDECHGRGHAVLCVLTVILLHLLQRRLEDANEELTLREILTTLRGAHLAVTMLDGEPHFAAAGTRIGTAARVGRERMPAERFSEELVSGRLRTSHMGAILRASGCSPVPSFGTRRDLAGALRTRFPKPEDALSQVILNRLDPA